MRQGIGDGSGGAGGACGNAQCSPALVSYLGRKVELARVRVSPSKQGEGRCKKTEALLLK